MAEYEVVEIEIKTGNLRVTIEHTDGIHEVFSYALGHGYEDIDSSTGKIRALKDVERRLEERHEKEKKIKDIKFDSSIGHRIKIGDKNG